ncbi:hypothetical protein J4481_01410 [Candidatus Pacearchaeota archaeon]|nr:hypothetical protein [Candidatus Pacearchaeota archaeon]
MKGKKSLSEIKKHLGTHKVKKRVVKKKVAKKKTIKKKVQKNNIFKISDNFLG